MAKRERKSIKHELGEEWLRRYEEGESPPKIAGEEYDVRTVRKHIERAMQERESNEARATVMRNALEQHYRDLCRQAEVLGGHKSSGDTTYSAQLEEALRQHIPTSPIWTYLAQIPKLQAEIEELSKELEVKVREGIQADSRLKTGLTFGQSAVVEGLIEALKFQIKLRFSTLNVEENFNTKPPEDGFVELNYGAFKMGKVKQDEVDVVRKVLIDWEARIKEWDEYLKHVKLSGEIGRARKNLRDETAGIALRRVVPGRCRYCPLQEYRRRR